MSENPASNSARGSEASTSASNRGSVERAGLSGLIEKLEQTYGLMGVSVSRFSTSDGSSLGAKFQAREDWGGLELGQALCFGNNIEMQEEGETDTVHQGLDSAAGTSTETNDSESARTRMVTYIALLQADVPFLNHPALLGSGGNVSELKQDGAYFYCLKSGLQNMGIHLHMSRSGGTSLVTTAIEDGRVTPAARFLARLSQTVGTGEADWIVISQDAEDDGRQGE